MRLTGSQKDNQTTEQANTQGGQDQIDQKQGQFDPDPSEPTASSGSILGKASFLLRYTGYSQRTEHQEQSLHINRSQINTPMFVTWLKPSRGK